jgi:sulfite reductase alpha subunit-like flavoprotein
VPRFVAPPLGRPSLLLALAHDPTDTSPPPPQHRSMASSTPAMANHGIPTTATSHPHDPIPLEPRAMPQLTLRPTPSQSHPEQTSPKSSGESIQWSANSSDDSEAPATPATDPEAAVDEIIDKLEDLPAAAVNFTGQPRPRRASTTLISDSPSDIRRILGDGETATKLISQCCGGGCCLLKTLAPDASSENFIPVVVPDNVAFKSLNLRLGPLALDSELTDTTPLPPVNSSFEAIPKKQVQHISEVHKTPPKFVQPHPPYEVYSAPLYHARELTKPGAEKRTIHFDIDVTDYPDEGGVDFKVGGAVGICPPNAQEIVDEVFDALCIPKFVRDKPVTLKTTTGRWPTIWGDDEARELVTTRRELLTWCVDIQSNPPTKNLLRVMAEHADAPNEKKILTYLCSAQGQAAFCDLRTSSHLTLAQILHAFPSSRPPLPDLLSVLTQLMPRFYSLSNDPHVSSARPGLPGNRRLIEMAVTIHETPNWHADHPTRTGVGSGFMERLAHDFITAEEKGVDPRSVLDLRVPMFRGLMANPLSKQFGGEGPMVLIGAGVGMAPFRGFILNRLKNANCANKIWLIQGVRDSMLDELYSGELGDHEREIKKVVQSRKVKVAGESNEVKYVQDEVRVQADIVWFVINALDGRIFVCGSSKGMGEGVEESLMDVAMQKGGISRAQAKEFWDRKKEDGQYIAVSHPFYHS